MTPGPASLPLPVEAVSPAEPLLRLPIRIASLLFFLTGLVWPLRGLPVTVETILTGAGPFIFGIHSLSGP